MFIQRELLTYYTNQYIHYYCELRMLPAISVNEGSSHHITASRMVKAEGTQEGNKECLPPSSHQTAATPDGAA